MSAAQHTPGPWVHHAEDNIISTNDGLLLLEWQARSTAVGVDERDANARLIAAAPDLLNACWNVVLAADDEERAAAKEQARAAIAKATKEQREGGE